MRNQSHPHLAVAAPLPQDVRVSFEFFPPKSDAAAETLIDRKSVV